MLSNPHFGIVVLIAAFGAFTEPYIGIPLIAVLLVLGSTWDLYAAAAPKRIARAFERQEAEKRQEYYRHELLLEQEKTRQLALAPPAVIDAPAMPAPITGLHTSAVSAPVEPEPPPSQLQIAHETAERLKTNIEKLNWSEETKEAINLAIERQLARRLKEEIDAI